jgi:hypothetical protein
MIVSVGELVILSSFVKRCTGKGKLKDQSKRLDKVEA